MTDLRARDSPLLSRLCACMHGRPAFLVRINPTGHSLSLSAPFLHFSRPPPEPPPESVAVAFLEMIARKREGPEREQTTVVIFP